MKIESYKIYKVSIPTRRRHTWASSTADVGQGWVILEVKTDDGIVGYGEATTMPEWGGDFGRYYGESYETTEVVIRDNLFPAIAGMDPFDIDLIHHRMDKAIRGFVYAKAAIDIALYDIMGKKKNLPVYKLLGGTDPVVHNDITIGIDTPEKMQAAAKRFVFEKGFRILKIKIGINPEDDLRALTLIREAVGEDIRLRVDANQGYNVGTALEVLPTFEKLHIDAVEQCLPWWDFDGAAELMQKNATSVKLMLDESIHTPYDAQRASKLHCADYYNIKLMKCGGLYTGAQIADIAQETGVKCMVGCMQENKISITAGVSLVAAKQAIVEADCDSFMFFKGDDDGIAGGFDRKGGIFTLLDKPGLGIDMDI